MTSKCRWSLTPRWPSSIHRADHPGQGGEDAAVDGGQAGQGLGLLAVDHGHGAVGQFGEDGPEQVGVEVAGGGGQGAQGGGLAQAEVLLDLVEGGGLLQAAQAVQGGGEEVKQQQGEVLVEVELAVAGLVQGAGAQGLPEFAEAMQVAEALEVFDLHRRLARAGHRSEPFLVSCTGGNSLGYG